MAIGFDTSASINTTTTAYTCTGSARLLVVTIVYGNSGSGTISSLTYNGVALTQAINQSNGNSSARAELWYLLAPASGAHNIVFSWSAGPSGNVSPFAASYTGVKALDATGFNAPNASNSTLTATVTTTTDNDWMIGLGFDSNGAGTNYTGTVTTTTQRQAALWDSNAALTPAGAKSVTFTGIGGQVEAVIAAAFSPSFVYTAVLSQGSYSLTGFAATFTQNFHYTISLVMGAFTYTGFTLSIINSLWARLTKNSSSFSNGTKDSSSWANQTKDASTFTNTPKSS